MLSVAPSSGALPFPKKHVDAAALLFADGDDGGLTSTEHSREVSDDVDKEQQQKKTMMTTETPQTRVVSDDDNDSDYQLEDESGDDDDESGDDDDESEDNDDESEDDDAHLESLESQLDEHADEVDDYYLRQMLAKRATLEGDEAAWVDSYIERQRQWKETHGTSIDEMDLDLLRVPHRRRSKKQKQEHAWSTSGAIAEAWNGRVSPLLPPPMREPSSELVLSLVAGVLFVGIALAVQFYVTFKAPQ